MPYIAIKAWPKDEETKKRLVEKINEAVLEVVGCPPQAVTITLEEFSPEEWEEQVVKAEIEPRSDKLMIRSGEKMY